MATARERKLERENAALRAAVAAHARKTRIIGLVVDQAQAALDASADLMARATPGADDGDAWTGQITTNRTVAGVRTSR